MDDCGMAKCVFGINGYGCSYHDTDLYFGNKCLNKDADGRTCPLLMKVFITTLERYYGKGETNE